MASKRRTRRLVIVGLVVILPVCAWLLWPRPSDERLILELVAKAEHGVETKNAQEIMECVSRDYRDPAGLTRTDIYRLAMHWQRSSEQLDVLVAYHELEITPPTARGEFQVELAFGAGELLGIPDRLTLTVEFVKERKGLFGRKWRVKSVGGHPLEKSFEELL